MVSSFLLFPYYKIKDSVTTWSINYFDKSINKLMAKLNRYKGTGSAKSDFKNFTPKIQVNQGNL